MCETERTFQAFLNEGCFFENAVHAKLQRGTIAALMWIQNLEWKKVNPDDRLRARQGFGT
jgi:hypothetical protein